ncbi:MAG: hypothetical protein Q7W45_11805 [Bacteroidota bacterium]|nr:hypothetical protein [Bacteroidota bacterium]MDP3146989.1 hypothetical protein [Bacteroidota bacterium]
MNLIVKLILLVAILTNFSSCLKKGEDDPLISFRTRKARVVGDWAVKSGLLVFSNISGNSSDIENVTITGNSYSYVGTSTYNNTSNINSFSGSFSYKFKFDKDGSFKLTQSIDGDLSTTTGQWNFTSGIGKLKNKEQLILNFSTVVNSSIFKTSYTGNKIFMTFNVRELRNKKMVIYSEDTSVGSGTTNTTKEEYTLEQ